MFRSSGRAALAFIQSDHSPASPPNPAFLALQRPCCLFSIPSIFSAEHYCCHAPNRAVIILFSRQKGSRVDGKITELQETLRRVLPRVLGCQDYAQEEQLLVRIDRILNKGGIEEVFLRSNLEEFEANAAKLEKVGEKALRGPAATERYLRHGRRALRCTILKNVVGGSYRQMSKTLAMSPLYQRFCRLDDFEVVRVPGKSTLRDYVHWLPVEKMTQVLDCLSAALADESRAAEIGLESELDLAEVWADTTCLQANIHFPTDWVLLRDGERTLVKSIVVIRRHGLRHRMPEPESLLGEINALVMGMAAASRRKPGGKKERERILRTIKELIRVIEEHGQRYRAALDSRWAQTDLSRPQAEVILRRMDNVLAQLPAARQQAHERIERRTQSRRRRQDPQPLRERSARHRARQSRSQRRIEPPGGERDRLPQAARRAESAGADESIRQQPLCRRERSRLHHRPRTPAGEITRRRQMAHRALPCHQRKMSRAALRSRGRPRLRERRQPPSAPSRGNLRWTLSAKFHRTLDPAPRGRSLRCGHPPPSPNRRPDRHLQKRFSSRRSSPRQRLLQSKTSSCLGRALSQSLGRRSNALGRSSLRDLTPSLESYRRRCPPGTSTPKIRQYSPANPLRNPKPPNSPSRQPSNPRKVPAISFLHSFRTGSKYRPGSGETGLIGPRRQIPRRRTRRHHAHCHRTPQQPSGSVATLRLFPKTRMGKPNGETEISKTSSARRAHAGCY